MSESSSKPENTHDPGAPSRFLDVEVKAYFRTDDLQSRDWQRNSEGDIEEEGVGPNESE